MNYSLIINVDDDFDLDTNMIVNPQNLFATNDTDCPAIFHELTLDANDDPSLATSPEIDDDNPDYFIGCTPNQRVEDLVSYDDYYYYYDNNGSPYRSIDQTFLSCETIIAFPETQGNLSYFVLGMTISGKFAYFPMHQENYCTV